MRDHGNEKAITEIERIHREYMAKVLELKKEKNGLIGEMISKMEQKKMEELRKKINQ